MQAVRFHPPGGSSRLILAQEPKPHPGAGQVLIRVHAASVIHPELTWPIYQDKEGNWTSHIPAHDYAGTIEEMGSPDTNTTTNSSNSTDQDVKVGTEVLAFTSRRNVEGGMAEYAVADLDQITPIPASATDLGWEYWASIPLSALTAWQALFDHGSLKKGERVLITGAAGGTGIWAVQFAKMAGAVVFGTGSSQASREIFERFIGAEKKKEDNDNGDENGSRFIDYKTEKLQDVIPDGVDLVLDCIGGSALKDALRVIKKDGGGRVVSINEFGVADVVKELAGPKVSGKFFIVSMNWEQLAPIAKMVAEGTVHTIVDSVFPLEKAKEAFDYAAEGHAHGKVVLRVREENL